jgi:hypothetical protein
MMKERAECTLALFNSWARPFVPERGQPLCNIQVPITYVILAPVATGLPKSLESKRLLSTAALKTSFWRDFDVLARTWMDQAIQSAIKRLHLSFIWAVASRPRNPKMIGMPLPGVSCNREPAFQEPPPRK